MVFMSLPSAWAQVKANRLRAIAVTSPERSQFVPDLPTVDLGCRGMPGAGRRAAKGGIRQDGAAGMDLRSAKER